MNDLRRSADHILLMAELEKEKKMSEEYITLKWGTLSAMGQKDTPRQKEIICELIELMPGKIFLDWDSKYVSKSKAKKYVMEYGNGS